MPFRYQLSLEAENDMLESYVWYETQKAGLGEQFLRALDLARESILVKPHSYKVIYKRKIRVYPLPRFPFLILYIISAEDINVISVFHTSRSPRTWKRRIR